MNSVEIKTDEEQTSPEKVIQKPIKPQNKKYKILYVEDDAIALSYISIVLKSLYFVDTAFSAKAALEKIDTEQYDVLMLDINLGRGMDGVELMQKLDN